MMKNTKMEASTNSEQKIRYALESRDFFSSISKVSADFFIIEELKYSRKYFYVAAFSM